MKFILLLPLVSILHCSSALILRRVLPGLDNYEQWMKMMGSPITTGIHSYDYHREDLNSAALRYFKQELPFYLFNSISVLPENEDILFTTLASYIKFTDDISKDTSAMLSILHFFMEETKWDQEKAFNLFSNVMEVHGLKRFLELPSFFQLSLLKQHIVAFSTDRHTAYNSLLTDEPISHSAKVDAINCFLRESWQGLANFDNTVNFDMDKDDSSSVEKDMDSDTDESNSSGQEKDDWIMVEKSIGNLNENSGEDSHEGVEMAEINNLLVPAQQAQPEVYEENATTFWGGLKNPLIDVFKSFF
jgi:hypothetical protein